MWSWDWDGVECGPGIGIGLRSGLGIWHSKGTWQGGMCREHDIRGSMGSHHHTAIQGEGVHAIHATVERQQTGMVGGGSGLGLASSAIADVSYTYKVPSRG